LGGAVRRGKMAAMNAMAAAILNSDTNFFLIPSMVDRPISHFGEVF
jgi:hypothetical protein